MRRAPNFNFESQFNAGDLFKAQSLIKRREIIGNHYLKQTLVEFY